MRGPAFLLLALTACAPEVATEEDEDTSFPSRLRDGGGFFDAGPDQAQDGADGEAMHDCISVERLLGTSTLGRAAAISRRFYNTSAEVVLGRGDTPLVDIALGATLARKRDVPLLLVRYDSIGSATLTELERLGANSATILGGDLAITADVESDLVAMGIVVTRFEGATRYDTAALVAAEIGAPQLLAVVAPGPTAELPTSIVAAGLASALGAPLLFVAPDMIHAAVANTIADLNIQTTIVVATESQVPDEIVGQLPNPTRISESDATQIAATVSEHVAAEVSRPVFLTRTDAYAEAAGAAALGSVLYTEGEAIPTATKEALADTAPAWLYILGKEDWISADVADSLDGACL